MKSWKRIKPTKIDQVGFRTIVTKTFKLPDGKVHDYQIAGKEGSKATGIIALTPDNRVIIARQYRPGPEIVMDELPGGLVDEGEDVKESALRELEEETGYTSTDMRFIGSNYKDAYNNGLWCYFLALDCVPTGRGQQVDEHEHVEVDFISIEQLIKNAKEGAFTDSLAVLMAYDELQKRMLQ